MHTKSYLLAHAVGSALPWLLVSLAIGAVIVMSFIPKA